MFNGTILTSPQMNKAMSGLSPQDFTKGFGSGNFGCDVSFDGIKDSL